MINNKAEAKQILAPMKKMLEECLLTITRKQMVSPYLEALKTQETLLGKGNPSESRPCPSGPGSYGRVIDLSDGPLYDYHGT